MILVARLQPNTLISQVSFKDEPGEGSGVARSFYVAFAQAVLSSEKLSSLDGILVGGKTLQYSMCLRTLQSSENTIRGK